MARHAKSSWNHPELKDFDRPLNKRGESDAPLMGEVLKREGVNPDLIISSPANRAQSTARIIADKVGYSIDDIKLERKVYGADFRIILELINELPNSASSVMLFGHNPTFTDVIERLASVNIGNLPTCGVSGISFEFDSWSMVSEGTGEHSFYDYPKNHK